MWTPVHIVPTEELIIENSNKTLSRKQLSLPAGSNSFNSSNSNALLVNLASTSLVSTLILLYFVGKNKITKENRRSTPLPGWGILGDRVNELIEIFLDTLAVYVHNDDKWNNCPQRFLCEANQRAVDYGTFYGTLTYVSSLFVSFWLQNRRVTSSMEAMRKGRQGQNCLEQYPCPVSL